MKPITKSVVRKLFRMKWRIISISMVVSLAMAMFVTGLYSAVIFDHSMEVFIEETHFPDIFVSLSEPVDPSVAQGRISGIPEIESYALRLKFDGVYHYNDHNYPAIIIGTDDNSREDISKLLLKNGKYSKGPGEGVVVGGMESINAKPGETLDFSIADSSFNIKATGTVATPEYIFLSSVSDSSLPLPGELVVLYMDLGELQNITGFGVNDILLLVEDGTEDQVIEQLDGLPISETTLQKDHPSVIFMGIGAGKMRNMFPLFSVIFMIVGMISIFMTFYRIVMNDSRYIGVFMSLGYTRARIIKAYLSFGAVLATLGSIFGLILGFLFTAGIMSYTISMIGDIAVSYPIAPIPFLLGLLFSYGSVLISVGIPIVLITRRTVRQALDHKPKTRILTVGNGGFGLSKTRLMGLRNTFRNPARTFLTIFVVGMSIGISGSWTVVSSSAWGYMQDQIDQDTWDLRIDFTTQVSNDNVTNMLNIQNADYVIPFAYLAGQATGGGDSESTYVVTSDRALEIRNFDLESGKLDLSTSILTNKLASSLGVSVGDRIVISVGPNRLETTIGGIVYDILMQAVYLDRDTASTLTPKDMSSGAFVKLKDKGQADAVKSELETKDGISKVTIQDDIIKAMDETFGSAMGMLYFFFIICLVIAMVVAASAIIISTMERDIEFATLETLGIPRSKVIGSMLIEIGILGFFSAALGIPFAYLFGQLFAVVMEDILYYFPVVFAVSGMLITFGFGFLFVMGSSIFPIRYTGKLDVETTIRERTTG